MFVVFRTFAVSYAVVKEIFNNNWLQEKAANNRNIQTVLKLTTIFLSLILLATVFAIIFPFFILRSIIYIYLKFTNENFGGFLYGISAMFEIKTEKSTIVNVFMLEYDENFYVKLKERVQKIHEANFKFGSVVESCFGYKYYIKNQVHYDEVFSKVVLSDNETVTKHDLTSYLEKYRIIDDRKLWEVKLFEQPLIDDKGRKRIAFMIRINHCISDAYFLIAMYKKYLIDQVERRSFDGFNTMKREKPSLDDLYFNNNPIFRKMDEFLFDGSDKEYIVSFSEENPEYTAKIKKIKNQAGVGFTDVLLAGLVASVSDFLTKKLGRCSNTLNIWLTARGRVDDLVNILNGSFNANKMENEFAMLTFYTPAISASDSALQGLKETHRFSSLAKSSVDLQFGYLSPKLIWQFLPNFMQRAIYNTLSRNICLMNTNMSAIEEGSIGGNKVCNILGYTALYMEQGIMLNTVTYNECLQLTLVGRQKFLDSREELQSILDNVLVYIDKLEQEVNKSNTTKNLTMGVK